MVCWAEWWAAGASILEAWYFQLMSVSIIQSWIFKSMRTATAIAANTNVDRYMILWQSVADSILRNRDVDPHWLYAGPDLGRIQDNKITKFFKTSLISKSKKYLWYSSMNRKDEKYYFLYIIIWRAFLFLFLREKLFFG